MPQEMQARREQDEWDVANGYRSTVDVYMDRHPGTSREDAIASLARVKLDQTAITREIQSMDPDEVPAIGVDPDDLLDAVGELSDAAEALQSMNRAGELDEDEMAKAVESISEAVSLLAVGHFEVESDEVDRQDHRKPEDEAGKDESTPEASLALNGAQVSAFVDVLKSVSDGSIEGEAALVLLQSSYPTVPPDRLLSAINSQKRSRVGVSSLPDEEASTNGAR